ncbi:MAG: response regulator transcription factor [Anaerolineae bacterium]|nr:response regulator transcription factor [Anaerolineae bacterium]
MGASKRILIVDDHRNVRTGITFALKLFPDLLIVGEASNGIDALGLCQELHPDVVLMDLAMPDMDGVATTMLVHEWFPDIKVIAITASGRRSQAAQDVLKAGAVDCLQKFLSIDELVRVIHSA